MSVREITLNSEEIAGVIKFVRLMTKSMQFDENMDRADWPKARRRNNFFYRLMPKQKGVRFRKTMLGSTGALEAFSGTPDSKNIILYLHGGGFVTGSAYVSKAFASSLAKFTGYRVYAAEYALAPEHPFPAGFRNCCEAFEKITELYPEAKIILTGESAGGNFCLGLAHRYKDTGKISSVVVHSPNVDFTGQVDHSINENRDFIVIKGCSAPLKKMYVGNSDPADPSVSPVCGDFSGFPPVFITCDANETLFADSQALYSKCEEAGTEVKMIIGEGGYHAFGTSGTSSPETKEIMEEYIAFMKEHSQK